MSTRGKVTNRGGARPREYNTRNRARANQDADAGQINDQNQLLGLPNPLNMPPAPAVGLDDQGFQNANNMNTTVDTLERTLNEIRNCNATFGGLINSPNNELVNILQELRTRNHSVRATSEANANSIFDLRQQCHELEQISISIRNVAHTNHQTIVQNIEDIRYLSTGITELGERTNRQEASITALSNQSANHDACITNIRKAQETLAQRMQKSHDELTQLIQARARGQNGAVAGIAKPRFELPTFSAAAYEKPGTFLKELVNYLQLTAVDNIDAKALITQALKGPAKDWWEHVESQTQNVEQFREAFMKRFWNQGVQDKVRQELELGYYQAKDNLSRSEYIYRLYNRVKMLEDAPPEASIVKRLSKHFDEQIQQAIIMQRISTIDALITLLDAIDQAGSINSHRGRVRFEEFPSRSNYTPRYASNDNRSPQSQRNYQHSRENSLDRGDKKYPPKIYPTENRKNSNRPQPDRPHINEIDFEVDDKIEEDPENQ